MKWSIAMCVCVPLLFAQQGTRVINYDGMGRPVDGPAVSVSSSGNLTSQTRTLQSVNGRSVPMVNTEERVVREDSHGRVVERVVRNYDANGGPGTVEKTIVEEVKRPDGGSTTRATTYRSDVSGNLALAERSVTESRKSGNTMTTDQTVDRPSINGAIEPAERRTTVTRQTAGSESTNAVLYRRGEDGRLYEAQRQVSETKSTKDESVSNQTTYESTPMGTTRLLNQTVSRSKKAADGSEQKVVDVYTANTPGVATAADETKPQLREQQVIRKTPTSTGATETVEVRRPSIADPARLGAPVRISETVCSGKCP